MELDKIEKLAELKEKGLITEQEYAQAKERILKSVGTGVSRDSAGAMDSRTYGMLLHFSQLLNFFLPLFGLIVPVVLWAVKREDPYIDQQGRVVFNWIISFMLYFVVCLLLMMVVVGMFLVVALIIVSIVFIVMGAVRAKDGIIQNYPLSIPFFAVQETTGVDAE